MSDRPLVSDSRFINGVGYLLALSVLFAVGVNVRKTYSSIREASQERIAGVQTLVKGQSKIRAGKYFYLPFRIDGAMEGAHVVGKFHTSGGPDKMVQVVIAEQKQLGKWADGQFIPVLYSTERTTNAQLDVPIPQSGDYYLGFSNMFSGSDENVFGDVELHFSTH